MSGEVAVALAVAAILVAPHAADAVIEWARAKYQRPDAAHREDETE